MANSTESPSGSTRRVALGRAEFVPLSRDDEEAAIEALAELLDQPARSSVTTPGSRA